MERVGYYIEKEKIKNIGKQNRKFRFAMKGREKDICRTAQSKTVLPYNNLSTTDLIKYQKYIFELGRKYIYWMKNKSLKHHT